MRVQYWFRRHSDIRCGYRKLDHDDVYRYGFVPHCAVGWVGGCVGGWVGVWLSLTLTRLIKRASSSTDHDQFRYPLTITPSPLSRHVHREYLQHVHLRHRCGRRRFGRRRMHQRHRAQCGHRYGLRAQVRRGLLRRRFEYTHLQQPVERHPGGDDRGAHVRRGHVPCHRHGRLGHHGWGGSIECMPWWPRAELASVPVRMR